VNDPEDDFERAMAHKDWPAVDAALKRMDPADARWYQEQVFHAKSYQKWAKWKQSLPDGTPGRR
jgi:hypothetical protein